MPRILCAVRGEMRCELGEAPAQHGWDLTVAATTAEAQEHLRDGQPDLVILDSGLPGRITWQDLHAQIRADASTSEACVLLLGDGDDGGLDSTVSLPDLCLGFPVRRTTLVSAVKLLLRLNEHRRTEARLRESEARLRFIADTSPDSIFIQDADLRYIWVTGGASPLTVDETLGRTDLELLQPEDARRLTEIKQGVLRTGLPVEIEIPMTLLGEPRLFKARYEPWRDPTGKIIGVAGYVRDIMERRRAADTLEEREERLRLVIEATGIGAFDFSPPTGRLVCSSHLMRHFGLSPDAEVDYKALFRGIHPEDRERVGAIARSVLRPESGGRYSTEYRTLGIEDGQERWIAAWGRVTFGDDGQAVRFIGVTMDITERRRAEEALRQSQARLRERAEELETIMEVVPVAIWVAQDPQCRKIHGNETANRFYEAAPRENVSAGPEPGEQVAPRRFFQDGRELSAEELPMQRAASENVEVRNCEFQVVMPSGTTRVLLGSARPLRDAGDTARGSVGAFVDITDRKHMEQELRAERDFTSAVLNTAASLVVVLDEEGRIVRFNKACETVTGYTEQEVLGRSYEILIPADELPSVRPVFQSLASGAFPASHENQLQAKDGSRRLLSWASTVIANATGEVKFIVATGLDITERKESEVALREANERLVDTDRRKNEFLAVLSHELRTPLAPILNSLYIMDRAVPGGDDARRTQAIIDRQVRQLSHLVDDLLDVTRITRNKIQLQRRRVELNELLWRTLEDHRSEFEEKEVRLQFEPALEPVFVSGDWNRLAQVIGNLLQNAVKFTAPGGSATVSMSVDATTRRVLIRVADTGFGMAGETLARVFEPFAQADVTLDRSNGGLGLGLALVKGLVELHGGEVEAHSEGLGQGAEFIVRLPLLEAEAMLAEMPHAADRRNPRRILIIEDNADAAESLRLVLGYSGHDVVAARDGVEGISRAREFRPEVVLCDIGLPGMDGYDVARAFRSDPVLRSAYLIALSGYALPEDIARAAGAGFDQHVAKPPNLERLQGILSDLVPGR